MLFTEIQDPTLVTREIFGFLALLVLILALLALLILVLVALMHTLQWCEMPCGKVLKFNPFNNRRHAENCKDGLCRAFEGFGESFQAPGDYERGLVQLIVETRGFMSPQDAVLKWGFVNIDAQLSDK
ncbi:hypothetical protein CTA2_10891 [Colletotrichum tanaceti]|uniref:Uncharacterized protein n=1 Tax=Colletotrichum tanaceti TaxID=1306861 RepID=A0A4U6X878_9PEZI|nr:hypothetical protein CTA2_10891 [Colletotrichum tanaceti]TKW51728.1 hypothetical protein CTA1_9008 [Colletotrichum tanaceti]